jgi:hypothetical protein
LPSGGRRGRLTHTGVMARPFQDPPCDVRQIYAGYKFLAQAENARSFRARHAGNPDASKKAQLAGEPRNLKEFFESEPGSRASKFAKLERMQRVRLHARKHIIAYPTGPELIRLLDA